jgi:hypothetical protein
MVPLVDGLPVLKVPLVFGHTLAGHPYRRRLPAGYQPEGQPCLGVGFDGRQYKPVYAGMCHLLFQQRPGH